MADIYSGLGTLLSSIGSIYQMRQGVSMQQNASKVAAQGYLDQATNAQQVADYNIGVDQYNLSNQLDSLSRNMNNIVKVQRGQQAGNGFDIGSASNISVVNAGIDQAAKQIINARNNTKILDDQRNYEAQRTAAEDQNKANLATYQGKVAAYQGQQSEFKFLTPVLNQLGSLFK